MPVSSTRSSPFPDCLSPPFPLSSDRHHQAHDPTPEEARNGSSAVVHDDHEADNRGAEGEVGDGDVHPGDAVAVVLVDVAGLGVQAEARQGARDGALLLRHGGEARVEQVGGEVEEPIGIGGAAVEALAVEVLEGTSSRGRGSG